MLTATLSNIPVSAAEPTKFNATQLLAMFGRAALAAVCVLMLIAALHPDVRNVVRGALRGEEIRQVVSTVQGHLAGDNRLFTVAKVKMGDVLSLEIFEQLGNGQQKLVEKIQLADARDGYFDFNGKASNLAIDDINGDGRPEIMAPTFDNNMVGHLNIYSFDPESNAVQKVIR